MRYCVVGPVQPLRGGIAHHTTLLCQHLGKRNKVDAVSFKRLYPSILFPGRSQTDATTGDVNVGAEWLLDSVNPLTWVRTGKHIRSLNPDVVIVQWWHAFFGTCMSSVLSRVHPAKVLFICHNVLPHESKPLMKPMTTMALSKGDAFIVHSNEQQNVLEEIMPGRRVVQTVLPEYEVFPRQGITKEEARAQLGLSGKVILFFGLVRKYKGLMDLIRAMYLLRNDDITCMVVGEFYDNKTQYTAEIAGKGIGDKVRIVDRYVPNDEVEPFFAAADVVVLPYISATQSSIVQMAYRFERPVIATTVGGLPEAVSDGRTGLLVPPQDPESLAGAIRRYFREGMEPDMVVGVRENRRRFSWDGVIESIEGLAESL